MQLVKLSVRASQLSWQYVSKTWGGNHSEKSCMVENLVKFLEHLILRMFLDGNKDESKVRQEMVSGRKLTLLGYTSELFTIKK